MSRPYNIYSAESSVSDFRGVMSILRSMGSGLVQSRYAAYRIFVKDVRAEYAKSMFGMTWDFVDPLVLGLIFYFLMQARVIDPGVISIPYAVFVIYGMLLYQTFTDSVLLPLNVITRSRGMLTHLNLSPEALLLSALYRILFNSVFRILVMLGFSLAMRSFSPIGFVKFLLLYPSIILAGMAFGVLLSPFNTIYTDVGRVTRIILNPLRYASPVLYTIPKVAPFTFIYAVNPIAIILSDLRSVATENQFSDLPGFALRVGLLLATFLVGWFVFHVSVPVIAERA